MQEECLICQAPLIYLTQAEPMECALCRKTELSKTRCSHGHYICSDCHIAGLDSIFTLCQRETGCDPLVILEKLMAQPFCHMHGPEHHVLVGAALLTAYRNAGGAISLPEALQEIYRRGREVPGGACGFWGACGAGISAGQFVSIVSAATPLSQEAWGLANQMTAAALAAIGQVGGPRCCKRDSYLSVLTAVDFVRAHLGIELGRCAPVCSRSYLNNQCIGQRCPFFNGAAHK